jgi:hypothetical protein
MASRWPVPLLGQKTQVVSELDGLRRGRHPGRVPASLPAGRAVAWRARVAGASSPAPAPTARRIMDRRRCPTEEKTQRPIVRTIRLSLGQGLRMNRAERRPSAGLHHGHHYLCAARHVEHDPVHIRAATRDLDEITWSDRLHREKVSRPTLLSGALGGTPPDRRPRDRTSNRRSRIRRMPATLPRPSSHVA